MEKRIYIGNLPPDTRTNDVEHLFYKYGKINYVNIKNNKGPPFAFIEFSDRRDAEDAVQGRDGYMYDGYKLRVEFSKAATSRNDANSYRNDRTRDNRQSRRPVFTVLISGLPLSGSWQDLKDHMREAGNICRSDVFKDGTGIVDYTNADDMKYAIRTLDNSKFHSHEGETSYIRVRMDPSLEEKFDSQSNSRSRSHSHVSSRSTTRSRSRSLRRSRSQLTRSRSRSPRRRQRSPE